MRSGYYKPRSIRRSEKKSKRNIIFRLLIALVLVYALLVWGLPTLINSLLVFNKLKPQDNQTAPKEQTTLSPPVLNIPFESTNSSKLNITGFSSPNMKVQIFIDDELKTETKTQDDGHFSADPVELSLGTNNIYGITIDNNNNKSLASKTIKLVYDNEKPKLEITSPQDGQEIKGEDKKLTVSGKTDPENSITINGTTTIVNNGGEFSTSISLNDGKNNIVIIATNSVGNTTKIERNVTFIPPTPTPSPTPIPSGPTPSPTP